MVLDPDLVAGRLGGEPSDAQHLQSPLVGRLKEQP